MFRSASLFAGTSFTVAVFTIFATSNVDSIVGIPHEIYSMQRILIHIKSRSLCWMCPSAPRVCSESGGQKPVLSLSLNRITIIDLYRMWFTHPCPNFKGGLTKPPLKVVHGWAIYITLFYVDVMSYPCLNPYRYISLWIFPQISPVCIAEVAMHA